MPSYAWCCPGCGKSNSPRSTVCGECGCPAVATLSDIQKARQAHLARAEASVAGATPADGQPYAPPAAALDSGEPERREKPGALPYVIGGISFIPLMGVLFGIVAIIWGLTTRKSGGKLVAALGAGGIACTVLLYGSLFYMGFSKNNGAFDKARAQLTQGSVDALVPSVEFYKLQNGRYPDSIEALQKSLPRGGFLSTFDPGASFGQRGRSYYYELVDEGHYYLRGVGADGKPFTDDDIVLKIQVVPGSKIGLLTERKS